MGMEIERRFLVRDPHTAIERGTAPVQIIQGYFGRIDCLRVRVRIVSCERGSCAAFLTFKGARRGLCRLEYEYPLPLDRARRALDTLPPAQIIRKTRYEVRRGNDSAWSVDSFEGPNIGLVLAEIELAHPNQNIAIPFWIGEEVTFNPRYGNSRLARMPMSRHLADVA